MHLIWATEDFVFNQRPYPRFPIILNEEMRSVAPANSFLRYYLTRGMIGSEQSWPNVGRALYDYLSFLEAHDLDWKEVRKGDEQSLVAAYRDYCLDVIGLAVNTVRQRVTYVCEFYKYAKEQGWINHLPFSYEIRSVGKQARFLAHVDASGGKTYVATVKPKLKKTLPKFLAISEVHTLLGAAVNPHHRMIIRLGLQTGLRREEIATFPVAYVFDPDARGRTERNIRIRLDPQDSHGMQTKGSKARDIYISRKFLKELHLYVTHTRGLRAQLSQDKYPNLFLNQDGQPYAASGKGIEKIVRHIGKKVEIKAWPHMLRHTYATHTLNAMQRSRKSIEPLIFLQHQLGHSSIQTTMIYLHLVNSLVDDAVLAYDDEINDWISEAG